jgi:hypothetical protein
MSTPLADRFADAAERLQQPALNPPSSPPAMGERAAWREPGASDLRAFQAPLVRTGGLPSRIR